MAQENLKIVMKVEVETKLPVTASVAQRAQLIQDMRAVLLPTMSRFVAVTNDGHSIGGSEVNTVGVRVTGDSINSRRA